MAQAAKETTSKMLKTLDQPNSPKKDNTRTMKKEGKNKTKQKQSKTKKTTTKTQTDIHKKISNQQIRNTEWTQETQSKSIQEPTTMYPCIAPFKDNHDVIDVEKIWNSQAHHRQQRQMPEVALIIKKHWCKQIFHGTKIWEIRGKPVTRRGRICIAESRSKTLVGEVSGSRKYEKKTSLCITQ